MRHVISVLLENESGALSRVAGLFSARGYNIESLTVAPTNDPTLSRLTVVTSGTERVVEQIIKQLNKLVDVERLSDIFKSRIIDVTDSSYIIEMTGDATKLNAFMHAVGEEQIIEVVRSGATGIARGEKSLKVG